MRSRGAAQFPPRASCVCPLAVGGRSRSGRTAPLKFFAARRKIGVARTSAIQYTALCNANTGGDPRPSATRAGRLLQTEAHFDVNAKGFTNVQVSNCCGGPDRRDPGGLRQSGPAHPSGSAGSDRHRRAGRGRRDGLAHRPGSRQGRGQSRLSRRRPDDRAAGPCRRRADRGPVGRSARSPDPGQCAALGSGQPRLARGGADRGAPHLLAAAAALDGRLGHARQFRRRPAEAPDR